MRLVAAGSRILMGRVGQVLANAAVVMVVAKTLGPTGQGHYSLTVALAMLAASLLGGGMGLAAVPPLRQGRIRPARMLRVQACWYLGTVLVLGGLALAATGPSWAPLLRRELGWVGPLAWLAAMGGAGMLGFEIFSYDLLARGRLVIGSAINGYRAGGHLVLILLFTLFGSLTFGRVVGAFAVAQVAGMLAILIVLLREIGRPARPAGATRVADGGMAAVERSVAIAEDQVPDDLDARPLGALILYNLRRGWLGQISAVAYFLLLRLDQGLLVHFRDAAEVGIYSIAVYVAEMLWLLPGALTPLLVHSSAAPAGDPVRDRTAARAVRLGFGLSLLAAVPLFFLAQPLLTLLAGGAYAGSAAPLRALLPGIVAFAPGAVLAGDFIGRGRPHWNTQASVLTVVINIAAGWALIPRHGSVGAAWASTLAYACGSGWMLVRFLRATGLTPWGLVRGHRERH